MLTTARAHSQPTIDNHYHFRCRNCIRFIVGTHCFCSTRLLARAHISSRHIPPAPVTQKTNDSAELVLAVRKRANDEPTSISNRIVVAINILLSARNLICAHRAAYRISSDGPKSFSLAFPAEHDRTRGPTPSGARRAPRAKRRAAKSAPNFGSNASRRRGAIFAY